MPSKRSSFPSPMVMRDIRPYKSPMGDGKVIDGRAEQREHLKRHGKRIADPSEFKVEFWNEKYARATGTEQVERPKPPVDMANRSMVIPQYRKSRQKRG